jgi:20S proteasome subunit beta 1
MNVICDKSNEEFPIDPQLCGSVLKPLSTKSMDVSTGTTIMAVEFAGGVLLGADTRTSSGQYVVNRASRKITQLHNQIFVARSGSAADTQALSSILKRLLSGLSLELGENPRVKTAASLMQLLCYQNKDNLLAGVIVAGYDSRAGGQVYQIPLGGTCLRVPFAIGGSGSAYISAYANSMYKKNMSKEECFEFVKKSIAHAISIDGSSGGLIRLTIVTKDSVEEKVFIANEVLK